MLELIDNEFYTETVDQELAELPSRLIIEHPPIFERWDRLDSEADFRMHMAAPVFAFGSACAYQAGMLGFSAEIVGLIVALGAMMAFMLLRTGNEKRREANTQLTQTITARITKMKAIEDARNGVIAWASDYIGALAYTDVSLEDRFRLAVQCQAITDPPLVQGGAQSRFRRSALLD